MRWLTLNGRLPWTALPLALVLVLGLALRLYGVDWDSGHGFHPDERDIYMRSGCMFDLLTEAPGHERCGYVANQPEAESGLPGLGALLDPERSPLNPHWFPLGSILIYLLLAFRSVIELFTDFSALDMRFVGRTLSALADTASIFLVFVLGRRMYGPAVGLLAAALTALAVIHIQNSHFYRPETFSVLFTLATFWAMLRMVERRRLRDSVLLGLMAGLALAPKVNVLPLVLPLALAYGYRVLDAADGRWSRIPGEATLRVLGHAALAAAAAVAVFFVSSPYAFLDFGAFFGDLQAQANMARHAGLWPFTIQYIDTPPFLYQFRQSVLWGLGLPLGVVAWLGVLFAAGMLVWRRRTFRADLLVLAWVVPSVALLASFEVRFLRYIFPLVPFLILAGSRMLVWLVQETARDGGWVKSVAAGWAARLGESWSALGGWRREVVAALRRRPGLGRALAWAPLGLLAFVVAATGFYALAFEQVYARDHPAVEASRWINDNVPAGTAIVSDTHWDENLRRLGRYDVWQYPVYEPDTPGKMTALADRLSRSGYLVFYSHRPYTSVARDPERFPLSTAYYRELFHGRLGYRLDRAFTSYPGLAGLQFRDEPLARAGLPEPEPLAPVDAAAVSFNLGYADDNVVGYDHPRVLLFRNVERLPREVILDRLTNAAGPAPVGRPLGLMLSDEERRVQREGGTWSRIFDRDGWTNRLPVLAWLLAVELVYLAALPLAMFLFRPLPDRGIVLARIAGLLAVGYAAWLLVSLGWMGFSRSAVLVGILVVSGLSAAVLLRQGREIKAFLRQHWRLLLFGEALFLIAFLAFVAVRAANPDLWHPYWGGEKPMELAYFNAVVRSTSLPPFDPWFAGGYLNYYYFGYSILGGLTHLTGILPATAFNLAVPLFFALTVTGAYTLVYNLAQGVRLGRASSAGGAGDPSTAVEAPGGWRALRGPLGAGLLAALFTAVIGNLDGIVQIVQNTWRKVVDGGAFPAFDYWRSSRMLATGENFDPSPLVFWLPDKVAGSPELSPHITEFPFFTFLFADLHAHLMVIPFTLLVIGLGAALVVGLRRKAWGWTAGCYIALAVALGSLWVINSWDYPTYVLLTLALLGLAVYFTPGPAPVRWLSLLALGAGVILLSLLAFLPFHLGYEAFNAGLSASRWRTPIAPFLGIHGLFLFVTASFLVYGTRRTLVAVVRGALGRPASGAGPDGEVPLSGRSLSGLRWLLGLGLAAAVLLAAAQYWTAVVLAVYLVLTLTLVWQVLSSRGEDRPFAAVPLVLLALGLLVAIGVDFFRVQSDVGLGRMNTLFKYYVEVWVLLALASAYGLWHLSSRGLFRRPLTWARWSWLGVLLLLVGSSLIYTALGTRERIDQRFNDLPATLDGAAYMSQAVHYERDQPFQLRWDQEAIRWFQDNVEGSPVVLEAHTEQYRWGSRIASYTGLPTVLGWPWHQIQQRTAYDFEVWDRAERVREVYDTTDLARTWELLQRYRVEYIVVGELERILYDPAGLQKFPKLTETGLVRRVFENEGVSIYRVDWPQVPRAGVGPGPPP